MNTLGNGGNDGSLVGNPKPAVVDVMRVFDALPKALRDRIQISPFDIDPRTVMRACVEDYEIDEIIEMIDQYERKLLGKKKARHAAP